MKISKMQGIGLYSFRKMIQVLWLVEAFKINDLFTFSRSPALQGRFWAAREKPLHKVNYINFAYWFNWAFVCSKDL